MKPFRRFLFHSPILSVLGLVALSGSAWAGTLRSPDRGVDQATLVADSQYMRGVLERKSPEAVGDAVPIDLADPIQYRFVLNRLRGAGKTPENSPRLFERLASRRARALSGMAPTASGSAGWGCDHFISLNRGTTRSGLRTFDSNPWAACLHGASYVYADMVAYNSNTAGSDTTIITSGAGEEYAAGQSFDDVLLHPSIAVGMNRQLTLDSMMIAANDTTGEDRLTFSLMTASATTVGADLSISHPRLSVPTSGKLNTELCQQRGGLECDYAMVTANMTIPQYPAGPTKVALRNTQVTSSWVGDPANSFPIPGTFSWSHIYMPTQLTFNAGSNAGTPCIIKQITSLSKVRFVKPVTGGTCMSQADVSAALGTYVGKPAASFNALVDLTRETPIAGTGLEDCTSASIINEAAEYVVMVSAKVNCGSAVDTPALVTVRMRADPRYQLGVMVWNSCMAAGTQVARADGTLMPVEQAKRGDKVLASDTGLALTVTDISIGSESEPMVILQDNLKHEVSLTSKHPVILASGVPRTAGQLRVGDLVSTHEGVATLTSVTRKPYTGKVYNLTLGTPEELAKAGQDAHLMFANGFRVGDNTLQGELSAPVADARPVLERLPKSWHRDFERAPSFNVGQP